MKGDVKEVGTTGMESHVSWNFFSYNTGRIMKRTTLNLREPAENEPKEPRRGLIRFWSLLALCIPARIRRRVFFPAFRESANDYAGRLKAESGWIVRQWIRVAFCVSVVLLVAQTVWVTVKQPSDKSPCSK
jgi:hypothetical protein